MKKVLIVLAVLLIIGGIYITNDKKSADNTKKETKETESIENKVENCMNKMTIDEKIAQMLVLYYTNDTVDDNLKTTLKNNTPGGFIITQDNITTYDKTVKFISDLKKNSKIPLILSIDQEGGNVQRLQSLTDVDVLNIPYMYDLGLTGDTKLAHDVGDVMAKQLKTIGINVVYAPDIDIYSNKNNTVIGKRSFGQTKEIVTKMSLPLAKGIEENGIITTYKHFPGHGDTETDSHISMPKINKTKEELEENELVSFKEAIKNDAKIIMIGHLSVPSIDGDTPATLSKKITTDLLKDELGYKGLVITDALNMGALTNKYDYEEIYTNAINAGVDLLLMPNGSKEAINLIKKNIKEDRIDESVRKILTFKFKYLKDYQLLDKSYLNNEEEQQIINKIKSTN